MDAHEQRRIAEWLAERIGFTRRPKMDRLWARNGGQQATVQIGGHLPHYPTWNPFACLNAVRDVERYLADAGRYGEYLLLRMELSELSAPIDAEATAALDLHGPLRRTLAAYRLLSGELPVQRPGT